jgi:predicted permease
MHGFLSDLRHAARRLAAAPGFTVPVAVLLSLGIGANAVFFHVIDVLLLRPLPVATPERLARLVTARPTIGVRSNFPLGVYEAIRDHARTAEAVMARYVKVLPLQSADRAQAVRVEFVSQNFYSELGVAPLIGRGPAKGEGDDSVVLSHRFWRESLAADRDVVGRKVLLQGHPFMVTAVMPGTFTGWATDTSPDLWTSLKALWVIPDFKPEEYEVEIVARLRPGISLRQAETEFSAIHRAAVETSVAPEWRDQERQTAPYLESIANGVSWLRSQFTPALAVLLGISGVVWLLVCANVAGLALGRSAARSREFAVRLAVGASRSQLMRLPLAESVLLTGAGGIGALLVSLFLTPHLIGAIPPVRAFDGTLQPNTIAARPDLRVLAFSLLVCLATMVLSGVIPAWQSTRVDLHPALNTARGTARWRGRRTLVVLQIALSMLLLSAAGFAVRTIRHFDRLYPGFDPDRVVTFTVDPTLLRYSDEQGRSLRARLLDQVERLPGVANAALSVRGVMRSYGFKMTIVPASQKVTQADFMNSSLNSVTPEYFHTMGMRLLAGRAPETSDAALDKSPIPVMVNQTFARRTFPDGGALGRTVGTASPGRDADARFVIAGIVSDARYRSLREPVQPTLYTPLRPGSAAFVLNVRTDLKPGSIIGPVLEILRTLDPRLPVGEVHPLEEEVAASLWRERLLAALATAFATVASLLACAGIYALLSHSVIERSREIAVRMAMGADPIRVIRWIARQSCVLAIAGVLLGCAGAAIAVPAAARLLGDETSAQPGGYFLAGVLIFLVAGIATAIPALRASRMDPAQLLKTE